MVANESGESKAYSNQVPHDRQHNIPSDGHKGNYIFISAFVGKAECTLKEKENYLWHYSPALLPVRPPNSVLHIYHCMSGKAVQENIHFKAGSIGLTIGRANTASLESKGGPILPALNRIFSCTAQPKECNNIFII